MALDDGLPMNPRTRALLLLDEVEKVPLTMWTFEDFDARTRLVMKYTPDPSEADFKRLNDLVALAERRPKSTPTQNRKPSLREWFWEIREHFLTH